MSLILDALRKSEAERQRGKSPGLFASTPGLPMPLRERLRLWPVLVFLLLLLASAWVIWRGESRRASSETGAIAAAATQAGVEVIDPPRDAARFPAVVTPPPAISPLPTPVVPTAQVAINGVTPPSASTSAAAATIIAQPAPMQILPMPPPMPMPPPTTAAEAPAEESLPTVAVLDTGTRASLPPLKLSMHVYGQDAAKRFAIIDGKRVSEGSLLGSGVVEAIRRDGVVLNVNGQRVLLPKP